MKILIADDEINLCKTLIAFFQIKGFSAESVNNGLAALEQLQVNYYDILLLDIKMPGMDGHQVLSKIKELGINVDIIMMSAHGDIEDAISALKNGAADYLIKPFDPEEMLLRCTSVYELRRLRQVQKSTTTHKSNSPALNSVYKLADKAAPLDATVLINGESGTGKEVLARYIHDKSKRSAGPFVALNMAGIPESLLESELFGYEKGAFTGAASRKIGYFESAAGGTLFLDEIGDMPLHLQVKILRAIQERRINRLGGTSGVPINIRIIAATHRNLENEVKKGAFREDLYYRLKVVHCHLPPLRDRKEDIPELTGYFLRQYGPQLGKPNVCMNTNALDLIKKYHFPGNIRELENMLQGAIIMANSDELSVADFPQLLALHYEPGPKEYKGTLRQIEQTVIRNALLRHQGKRAETADELGISRRTLLNKIKEYGLE